MNLDPRPPWAFSMILSRFGRLSSSFPAPARGDFPAIGPRFCWTVCARIDDLVKNNPRVGLGRNRGLDRDFLDGFQRASAVGLSGNPIVDPEIGKDLFCSARS